MKKYLLIVFCTLLLAACTPVLKKDLMNQGTYPSGFSEIKEDPASNKGQLFILGGIIVKTTITKEGSLIEAIFVPVNSRGYLKNLKASEGRFLALYRGGELLDPLIYSEKREITLAGEFIEMRTGMIDEIEYSYPFFEIKEIYLWENRKDLDRYYYYGPPPYRPYYYPYPYRYYDPWYY
jgi:outer membrane lipoprotein